MVAVVNELKVNKYIDEINQKRKDIKTNCLITIYKVLWKPDINGS